MKTLTVLEVAALVWPDRPAPDSVQAYRNTATEVRKWLARRGVSRCGSDERGRAAYAASEVEEALRLPRRVRRTRSE